MTCTEFELEGADGRPRFARAWIPLHEPLGAVGIVHGLGEHSGCYVEVAEHLNRAGLAVVAFDQRGHGRSPGQRGHVRSYESLLDDVEVLVREVEHRAGRLPRFLYGHSLGGNLVLNLALRRSTELSGLVVASPLLRLAVPPPRWKVVLGHTMNLLWPSARFRKDIDPADLSHDAQAVQRYRDDPLIHQCVSARLGVEMLAAGRWALRHAAELSLPALLMHGEADRVTSAAASREFAARSGSRCTLKIWDGLFHELHWETQRALVLDDVARWLLAQLK